MDLRKHANATWLVVAHFVLLFLLAGCQSYRLPVGQRPAFPLPTCDESILKQAAEKAKSFAAPASGPDFSAACVTKVELEGPVSNDGKSLIQAVTPQEAMLRAQLETPFMAAIGTQARPVAGLALSGGGSKAAAVGMGVLAGLSDAGLLSSFDYISSVSGGGYAAYYYYSHNVRALLSEQTTPRQVPDLFTDCVSLPDEEKIGVHRKLMPQLVSFGVCNHRSVEYGKSSMDIWQYDNKTPKDNRMQAFVRCKQDMLDPARCSVEENGEDVGWQPYSLFGTVAFAPWSNVVSTIFDWGYSTAPTAKTYRDGIGMTYSVTPHRDFKAPQAQGEDRYSRWYRVDCDPRNADAPNDHTVVGCKDNILIRTRRR